jgi:hypothetical protein
VKRSAALAALARDHHQALVVAQALRRASDATAEEARASFLTYWTGHGERHFRLEAAVPRLRRLRRPTRCTGAARARRTHDDSLSGGRAGGCTDGRSRALERLGVELAAHVRLEEREVFPLIERVTPSGALESVAQRLEAAKQAPEP